MSVESSVLTLSILVVAAGFWTFWCTALLESAPVLCSSVEDGRGCSLEVFSVLSTLGIEWKGHIIRSYGRLKLMAYNIKAYRWPQRNEQNSFVVGFA